MASAGLKSAGRSSPVIREPRLWIALWLITIYVWVVFAGPGPDSRLATLCLILAQLAALLACFRAAAKSSSEARRQWALMGFALLIAPLTVVLFSRSEMIGIAGTTGARNTAIMFKTAYGAALLFAVGMVFDSRVARTIRAMAFLLVAAADGLLFIMVTSEIASRGIDQPEDLVFFARLAEATLGFSALIATLRILTSEANEIRGFFFGAAVFLWFILLLLVFRVQMNFLLRVGWAAVFAMPPYLFLFVFAGHDPPRLLRDWQPSTLLLEILRHIGAFFLSFQLIVAGIAVSKVHFWLGSGAVLLAVLCYLLLNLITRSHSVRETEALRAENQALGQLVDVDGLTGIANRYAFDKRLQLELDAAKRSGQPLSLLLIDVDLFKNFNDSHGHLAGDSCLVQAASAVSSAMTRATDFAARYGGEEFAVILPMTDRNGALGVADAIHLAVFEMACEHPASPFGRITVSIGAATARGGVDCIPGVLISAADRALYSAKAQGRNRSECEPAVKGSVHLK